jgi:hypothetical protein
MSVPLESIGLGTFLEFKGLAARGERGEPHVSSQTSLRVMNHPSSRSHIFRTFIVRLERDIIDFARI